MTNYVDTEFLLIVKRFVSVGDIPRIKGNLCAIEKHLSFSVTSAYAKGCWALVIYLSIFSTVWVKYGGHGCTIAFGYEDHGSFYRLNVYNTGRPVPEEKHSTLFTRFGRVEGETVREGVGMGLFLVKEIINQHGGDIWYEAKHNGSDFVFTLPK